MPNRRNWTAEDDQQLVDAVLRRESTLRLADTMGRTHQALVARAARIGLMMDLTSMALPD